MDKDRDVLRIFKEGLISKKVTKDGQDILIKPQIASVLAVYAVDARGRKCVLDLKFP